MNILREDIAVLHGHRIKLRLICPDDADYLYGLRTDPAYNRHISAVTGTACDQRRWIEVYTQRENAGLEYYYIIERHDGIRCGTVRAYDVGPHQCIIGSLIIDHNRTAKAAMESMVLMFGLSFDHLGLAKVIMDVRHGNFQSMAMLRRLGSVKTGQDADKVYFEMTRDQFARDRAGHAAVLAAGGRITQ